MIAHFIKVELSGHDPVIMGDWCCENIKKWSIINPNGTVFCNDITWGIHRWNFQGLSDMIEVEIEIKIEDDADALAFKLRWL